MANKRMKTLQLPGLSDVYTFVQADSTLTQAGEAADAKATGDKISGLKSAVTEETDNLFWFSDTGTFTMNGITFTFLDRSTVKVNGTATADIYLPIRGGATITDATVPAGTYIYNMTLLSGTGTVNKLRYGPSFTPLDLDTPFTFDADTRVLFRVANGQTHTNAVYQIMMNSGTELKPYIEGGLTADDKVCRRKVADMSTVVDEIDSKFENGLSLDDFVAMLQGAFRYEYEAVSTTLTSGQYMDIDGNLQSNSTTWVTSISVTKGQHYKLTSKHGALMKMYVLINNNNEVVDYYPRERVSTLTETKEITIISNGTLYINTFSSTAARIELAYGITAEKASLDIPWYLFGDSWSAPVDGESKWCEYVAKALALTQHNFAVSGTGYKKGTSYFGKRINDKLPAGFTGIITVFGSGNDCDNSVWDLGTSDDLYDPDDVNSQDTIGGRINYAFGVLKARAPLAKVLIIGPCPWQIYSPLTVNNKMLQYIAMLDECCKKAGFVFVDMYYRSGLRPWDDTQAALWVEQSPTNRVHPNPDGHYFLYPQMADVVRQMLPGVAQAE